MKSEPKIDKMSFANMVSETLRFLPNPFELATCLFHQPNYLSIAQAYPMSSPSINRSRP